MKVGVGVTLRKMKQGVDTEKMMIDEGRESGGREGEGREMVVECSWSVTANSGRGTKTSRKKSIGSINPDTQIDRYR